MLRLVEQEDSQGAVDNVISLHPVVELNIVELDNVSEIVPSAGITAAEPCVDGVCSINWKPSRPSAA
ncbi:MAG: hypothetical protein JST89_03265 [Cyanobacteria bacterium SZAS-4]|nr:hypothetical protein [Cyanobacteria bacterium SZAS-4]